MPELYCLLVQADISSTAYADGDKPQELYDSGRRTLKMKLAQQWLLINSAICDLMLVRYVSGTLKGSFGSVYAFACLHLNVRTGFR